MEHDSRSNGSRCQWRRKRTRRRKLADSTSLGRTCSVIDSNWIRAHSARIEEADRQVPRPDPAKILQEALLLNREFCQQNQHEAQHDLTSTNNSIKMLNNHTGNIRESISNKLRKRQSSKQQASNPIEMIATKCRHKPTKDRASPLFLTLLMVTCCCFHLISCQMRTSLMQSDPSQFIAPSSTASSQSLPIGSGNARFDAEPRALDQPLRTRNIDQLLVNNLLNYQLNQNSRRVQPLPLNNQRIQATLTQQQPQQQQQQQAPQFANSPGNFMPNRRPNFPQANLQQNSNQLGFVSSSPATPYLTLNRIANQQLANNQNRPIFSQSPQPINTIPLGGLASMSGGSSSNNNANRIPLQSINRFVPPQTRLTVQQGPTRGVNQQAAANQGWTSAPAINQAPSVAPAPQQQQNNPLQPLTGFAPSGPPPSLASNNALVVVQSPASSAPPSQQQVAASTQPAQAEANLENKTLATNEDRPPTSTEDRLDASSEASAAVAPDDKGGQATTTLLPVNTLRQSTTESAPASSESPSGVITTAVSNEEQLVAKDSNWNPVESNRTLAGNKNKASLSPSPDIVTVPPGYNPDSANSGPQNFDISVSAKMGGNSQQQPPNLPSSSSPTPPVQVNLEPSSRPSAETSLVIPTAAPTAVTTIIWSPSSEASIATSGTSVVQPTRVLDPSRTQASSTTAPVRIRDFSLNDEPSPPSTPADLGVVYGKAQAKDSKPVPPAAVSPSPVTGQASFESSVPASGRPFIEPVQMDNQVRPFLAQPGSGHSSPNLHRTQAQQQPAILKSNHGHSSSAPFRPSRPLHSSGVQSPPLHVGSGFTITANGNQTMPLGDIQDYVAGQPPSVFGAPANPGGNQLQTSDSNNEPTISAQGGQDPANFDLGSEPANQPIGQAGAHLERTSGSAPAANASSELPSTPPPTPPRIRRPTFKPKPAVPPIRIDSCIVGDDSSCDQSHNERCITEYGISSCHCKPGYARLSQLRGYCNPVSTLQLNFKIDKLSDERRLVYNNSLANPNSEEYQYLEFETMQALAGAFQQTPLSKQFMGARVNKFYGDKGKVWANVSINFELNNLTKTERIQSVAAQELHKVGRQNPSRPLGDSTIMLDGNRETISRLVDINECANKELNDCSKHANCINDFGGFQCQCLPGYEDKYLAEEKSKHGRVCLGCPASYCSNRGECSIVDGQRQCKCRPNFIGDRCDYNSEILVLIIGCSLVCMIILIFTIWGLYFVNRRWKRHDSQPKLDAMSATSGLTYNYVNSSTNSLMSPASRALTNAAGLHRAGNQQVTNYGQRFGAALAGGARGGPHYALDQQAIIGSTSSGSSASSQPIGCNPYAAGQYQYDDGGLLIASASTGSSEQTSPSDNSYRGIMAASGHQAGHSQTMLSQLAANAYTLSGHHHHHHHHPAHHQMHQHHHQQKQLSQFNPVAEYRTMHCAGDGSNMYDQGSRWRTLQQENPKQSALVGYYLSPEMLQQQNQQLQQLYASPQRELCIDTGANSGNNKLQARKQQGRAAAAQNGFQSTSRSRQAARNGLVYHEAGLYDYERPI